MVSSFGVVAHYAYMSKSIDCDVNSNKVDVENISDLLSITNVSDYRFIISDPLYGDLEIRWSKEAGRFLQPIKKISKSEFMGY